MSGLTAQFLTSCRILYWAAAQPAVCPIPLAHLLCPTCALSLRGIHPWGGAPENSTSFTEGWKKIYPCYSLIFSELFLWPLKAFLKAPCSAASVKGIYYKFSCFS